MRVRYLRARCRSAVLAYAVVVAAVPGRNPAQALTCAWVERTPELFCFGPSDGFRLEWSNGGTVSAI